MGLEAALTRWMPGVTTQVGRCEWDDPTLSAVEDSMSALSTDAMCDFDATHPNPAHANFPVPFDSLETHTKTASKPRPA
jgi:hypothetical protein